MTRDTYLYAIGRLGLPQIEHDTAAVLAALFFAGSAVAPLVRVSPTWIAGRGVVGETGTTWATRALWSLANRGVLRWYPERGDHLYALEMVLDEWGWPDGRLEMVRAELRAMRGWGEDGWMIPYLSRLVLLEQRPSATPHPHDPIFGAWLDTCRRLARRFGQRNVVDALCGALDEPEVLIPFGPTAFDHAFYALLQRQRRREHVVNAA